MCPHNRPPILCETCADAEVEKHKQLWQYNHMQPTFRLNGTVLEKAGAWVGAELAELEAEAERAAKNFEAAAAHNAQIQALLAEAKQKLAQPAPAATSTEQPQPPSF